MTKRSLFKVGEIIRIKQSMFRVKAIRPDKLTLKLLPAMSEEEANIILLRQERAECMELKRRGIGVDEPDDIEAEFDELLEESNAYREIAEELDKAVELVNEIGENVKKAGVDL